MREVKRERDTYQGRMLKRGDIVRVRHEWLDPGEDANMKYLVLEESGVGRLLVQALNTGLKLPPTYVYDVTWLTYVGCVSSKKEE